MDKDSFYFSHDCDARDDPKCMLLIEQLGLEGYGIFWVLIELLRQQPDYQYPVELIPVIARRYNTSTEKVKTVVENYGLFHKEDGYFWSASLLRRMEKRERIRELAAEAGRASGQKRRQIAQNRKLLIEAEPRLNARSTDVEEGKERKGKENKGEEREENNFSNNIINKFHTIYDTAENLTNENLKDLERHKKLREELKNQS